MVMPAVAVVGRRLALLLGALLVSVAIGASPPPTPPAHAVARTSAQEGQDLLDALRAGGHVIYFRHGMTDQSQRDTDTTNLENCETQRNLSEEGRAQAQAMGEAIRALGIPIGRVLSSNYCRARDTARLAFGDAEILPELVNSPILDPPAREAAAAVLRRLIVTPPPDGTNTVIVSHIPNLIDVSFIPLNTEAEAAIFWPNEQGTYLVTRLLPTEWSQLARP
jgi:phosphohistidine phosphatase SixA